MPDDWLFLAYVYTYGSLYRRRVGCSSHTYIPMAPYIDGELAARSDDWEANALPWQVETRIYRSMEPATGKGNRVRMIRAVHRKREKKCRNYQLKTILKQHRRYLTLLPCSCFPVLTCCKFFYTEKADTACYIHPVTTAAEARSARKRALDRKRAEPCQTPPALDRCGHFDEEYVAALKGTCHLNTFGRVVLF
jgi:hypothetical protein